MTLEVIPDAAGALRGFIAEQHNEGYGAGAAVLSQHSDIVLRLFDISGCKILRVLRFAVSDFTRLFNKICTEVRAYPEALIDMLTTSMAIAIEVHRGDLKASSIHRLRAFSPREASLRRLTSRGSRA